MLRDLEVLAKKNEGVPELIEDGRLLSEPDAK